MSSHAVRPEDVVCPHCQAEPTEPCFKPNGQPVGKPHKRREELARKLNAQHEKALAAPDRVIGERWRRVYVRCRVELEGRDDWTTLAAEQLEAMVKALAMADTCADQAARDPLVKGSQDQEVANPLHSIALRYSDKALSLAKALKLTPDTRGARAAIPEDPATPAEDEDELAALDEVHRKRLERKRGRPRK